MNNEDKYHIWRDGDNHQHLMIGDKELTKGLKCTYAWTYENGDWAWEDDDENWYQVKKEEKNHE